MSGLKDWVELEFLKSMTLEEINATLNQQQRHIKELQTDMARLIEIAEECAGTLQSYSGPDSMVFKDKLKEIQIIKSSLEKQT